MRRVIARRTQASAFAAQQTEDQFTGRSAEELVDEALSHHPGRGAAIGGGQVAIAALGLLALQPGAFFQAIDEVEDGGAGDGAFGGDDLPDFADRGAAVPAFVPLPTPDRVPS